MKKNTISDKIGKKNEFSCAGKCSRMNFHVYVWIFMCQESFLNTSKVILHVGHLKRMAPLCPWILTIWFPKTPGFWKTLQQLVQLYFSAGSISNCSWSFVSSFFSSATFGMGFFAKKASFIAVIESMYSWRLGLIGQQTQQRFFSLLWLFRSIMTMKKKLKCALLKPLT